MNVFERYIANLPPCSAPEAYEDRGQIIAYEDDEGVCSEKYHLKEMSCTFQNEFVTRSFAAADGESGYGALVWIATEGHLGIIFGNRRDFTFQKELRQELATAVYFPADCARPKQGMPAAGSPDIGDALIRLSWIEVCDLIFKYRPSINLSSLAIIEAPYH